MARPDAAESEAKLPAEAMLPDLVLHSRLEVTHQTEYVCLYQFESNNITSVYLTSFRLNVIRVGLWESIWLIPGIWGNLLHLLTG